MLVKSDKSFSDLHNQESAILLNLLFLQLEDMEAKPQFTKQQLL